MQFLHRDSAVVDGRVVQIAFVGKGLPRTTPETFGQSVAGLLPAGVEPAWLRQVHSADVALAEAAGPCGPADALVSRRSGLALAVVTADCVPVLFAGEAPGNGRSGPQIAAVHAGWRGVAAGIVAAAISRFAEPPAVAWIGPAISGTVYEVGEVVAAQVEGASDPSVVSTGAAGREHVDLRRAVEIQLRRAGTLDIRHAERCTFSDPSLWSYRRDGERAGRNVALIWMEGAGAPPASSAP